MAGAKISTKDWRNLPIEKWNTTTVRTYLIHLTEEKFGVAYEPTGAGSKNQRWVRENAMIKQAIANYGAAELKRFIEICIEKYSPKPQYPYMTFTFAWSYMRENMPIVQAEIEKERAKERRKQDAKEAVEAAEIDEGFF